MQTLSSSGSGGGTLGPGEGDEVCKSSSQNIYEPFGVCDQHNSSDVTIRFQLNQDGAVKRIRSRLELQLNREDSASNTAFWCSVLAWPNSTADATDKPPRALPSEAFVLRVADVYADLPICGGTPQSSEGEKCATAFNPLLQPATPSSNTSVTAHTQSVSTMGGYSCQYWKLPFCLGISVLPGQKELAAAIAAAKPGPIYPGHLPRQK